MGHLEFSAEQFQKTITERSDAYSAAFDAGDIEAESALSSGAGFRLRWQLVRYGPKRENLYGGNALEWETFRGYLMVEPPDFIKALDILDEVGRGRRAIGKRLEFKWLTGVYEPGKAIQMGSYDGLLSDDPRIVVYEDSTEEVQAILQEVASDPRYLDLEENRVKARGGRPENAPRLPGTSVFVDNVGREFRSLDYNLMGGYSEDAAMGDWRSRNIGSKTVPSIIQQ